MVWFYDGSKGTTDGEFSSDLLGIVQEETGKARALGGGGQDRLRSRHFKNILTGVLKRVHPVQ